MTRAWRRLRAGLLLCLCLPALALAQPADTSPPPPANPPALTAEPLALAGPGLPAVTVVELSLIHI